MGDGELRSAEVPHTDFGSSGTGRSHDRAPGALPAFASATVAGRTDHDKDEELLAAEHATDAPAVAGVTLPLVDPSLTPDGAAGPLTDGLTSGPSDPTAMGTENDLPNFAFLGVPLSGFKQPAA